MENLKPFQLIASINIYTVKLIASICSILCGCAAIIHHAVMLIDNRLSNFSPREIHTDPWNTMEQYRKDYKSIIQANL